MNFVLFRKPVKSKQKTSNKKSKKIIKEKNNKSQESMDVSNLNITNIVDDGNNVNILENEMDISIYHAYFRELDIDTWLILTQKFVINPAPENVSLLYNV